MTPEEQHLRAAPNLVHAVLHWSEATPDAVAQRYWRDGVWRDLTWRDLGIRVRAIAAGLVALGVRPGDRVAIMSANRVEWALADLGALAVGAVVVSVYPTLPPEDAVFPVAHAGCRLAFVEDPEQAAKLAAHRDRLPELETVVVLDGSEVQETVAFEAVASREPLPLADLPGAARTRDDLATILYTSGTTGVPKGVQLDHGNILAVLASAMDEFSTELSRLQRNLSFLPLAHALERLGGHFLPLTLGRTVCHARSLETVAEDFRVVRPHFVVAVPRVFEKIHAKVMAGVAAASPARRRMFHWCLDVGLECSRREEAGRRVPWWLGVRRAVADRLVLHRLRTALGGEVVLLVSGGAPLAADVARFFHAAGVLVCEGWGATETAAPSTFNTPRAYRFGSVGRPLPGVEVEVDADGELLVRGPNVFRGYWRQPELDAEVFDGRGFWRTGDIGRIDDDGFVWITDRKKELIVTSGGKNIAPQRLETMLKERPGISNAMVVGDRRPYVVALLTLDREAIRASSPQLADLPGDDPRIVEIVGAEVEAVNARLARFESIKRFALVEPDFSVDGGELTVTLKLKRRVIADLHADTVEGLYR